MKVLVTGAGGQLGRTLLANAPPGWEVRGASRANLDICDRAALERQIDQAEPQAIINTAAYTNVDGAEAEPALARAINADGAGNIGNVCARHGIRALHISTDFVFDGEAERPYSVTDPTGPLSVYGATKLAGEQAIAEASGGSATILRTAWVYSAVGHNFLLTMIRLLRERDEVAVVDDQLGSPTHCLSIAAAVYALLGAQSGSGQILHCCDAGIVSRFGFAQRIRALLEEIDPATDWAELRAISSAEFPTPARRPAYSALAYSESLRELCEQKAWEDALEQTLRRQVQLAADPSAGSAAA